MLDECWKIAEQSHCRTQPNVSAYPRPRKVNGVLPYLAHRTSVPALQRLVAEPKTLSSLVFGESRVTLPLAVLGKSCRQYTKELQEPAIVVSQWRSSNS